MGAVQDRTGWRNILKLKLKLYILFGYAGQAVKTRPAAGLARHQIERSCIKQVFPSIILCCSCCS